MSVKTKSGIIHCANYVCNGCPYETIMREAAEEVTSSSAAYVRCMQKLVEDIYDEIKEVDKNERC